jgi:hypothetical protein
LGRNFRFFARNALGIWLSFLVRLALPSLMVFWMFWPFLEFLVVYWREPVPLARSFYQYARPEKDQPGQRKSHQEINQSPKSQTNTDSAAGKRTITRYPEPAWNAAAASPTKPESDPYKDKPPAWYRASTSD